MRLLSIGHAQEIVAVAVLISVLPPLSFLVNIDSGDIGRNVPMLVDVNNVPHSAHQMLQFDDVSTTGDNNCIKYARENTTAWNSKPTAASDLLTDAEIVIGSPQAADSGVECALTQMRITTAGIAQNGARLCKARETYRGAVTATDTPYPQGIKGGLAQAVAALGSIHTLLKHDNNDFAQGAIRMEQLCAQNDRQCYLGSSTAASSYERYVENGCTTTYGTSVFDIDGGMTSVDDVLTFTRVNNADAQKSGHTVGDWLTAQGVSISASNSNINGYIVACLVLSVVFAVLHLAILEHYTLDQLVGIEQKIAKAFPSKVATFAVLVVLSGLFWEFVYTPLGGVTNGMPLSPHFVSSSMNDDFVAYLVRYVAILLVVLTVMHACFGAKDAIMKLT